MSQANNDTFKPRALKRISEIIGDRYKGWQLGDFFNNAGFPDYEHDGRSTKWVFVNDVLNQIQSEYGTHGILRVLEQLCDPQEYFTVPATHKEILTQINNLLRFFGFRVEDNGKVINIQPVDTFPTENKEPNMVLQQKINVLAVFANPTSTNRLRLGTEDRTIKEAIQLSRNRDNVVLKTCHAATTDDLRRALLNNPFHIVHISGHGEDEGLLLETSSGHEYRVPPEALAKLFSTYSPPIRGVVLNACYSASQAEFISVSVPFTIAMNGPIYDDAAIEFSKGFYDAIGAGKEIDEAFQQGQLAVALNTPHSGFIAQLYRNSNAQQHITKDNLIAPRESSPINPHSTLTIWQDRIASKLNEFSTTWTFIYGKEREKLYDPFLSDLRTKFLLISEQLITLIATSPQSISKNVINSIGSIAKGISNLGHMPFYMDGGKSVDEFDMLGDNIAEKVETILEQLNSDPSR